MDTFTVAWRKSSRSQNNGVCVEAGIPWRKSSRSQNNGTCVESALVESRVAARDSKFPQAGMLIIAPEQWGGLLAQIKSGRLG